MWSLRVVSKSHRCYCFYHKSFNFIKCFLVSLPVPVRKFLVDDQVRGGAGGEKGEEKQDKFRSAISCMTEDTRSVLFSALSHHLQQQCLLNERMAWWMMDEQTDTIYQNGPQDQEQKGQQRQGGRGSDIEGHSPES